MTKLPNPLDLKSVRQCDKCQQLGTNHAPSEGSPAADLMIIGQSPGTTEVRMGRPFVGPSGELVDFMLDGLGLSREDVYIANALKCQPPGNRPGMASELANCWNQWLYSEIKLVDPKVVLLLGRDAHQSVIKNRRPWKHRAIHRAKKRIYVDCWHPSYCLRRRIMDEFVSMAQVLHPLLEE